MRYRQYSYKFYLNASHSIYIHGVKGQKHPHTWEVILDCLKVKEGFVEFKQVEKEIESFLLKYQDQYLNDCEPFDTLNPTLENVCMYLKNQIKQILLAQEWVLLRISLSETPARSYYIDLIDENEYLAEVEEENLSLPSNDANPFVVRGYKAAGDSLSEMADVLIDNFKE